jgi:hypothetical protein
MEPSHTIHFNNVERDEGQPSTDNEVTQYLYYATGVTSSFGQEQAAASLVYKYRFRLRGVNITAWELTIASDSKETQTIYER